MTRGDTPLRPTGFPLSIATLAVLTLVFALPIAVRADETSSDSVAPPSASAPIQYRRIFVPAEKVNAWPREGEKLIPIEAREFEELIRSAKAAHGDSHPAAVSAAEYSAHLDDDGQLRGNGQWTIVAHGEKPTFLPLSNLSLVLRTARWQDQPLQTARIGMWGQSAHSPSRLGVEVIRSGTLKFDWQAQTHSVDDQLEIPWSVPVANSTRLTLDLPQGKLPQIEGGVVLEQSLLPSNDKTPSRPLRRWIIGLAPVEVATLRISSTDRKPSRPDSQTVLKEDVNYRIEPHGLEVTTTWLLEGSAEPMRELTVAVPAGVQLASIKSDGHDVAWRLQRDTSSHTDTAIIELPKSPTPKPSQITYSAWQPVVVDAPWRLPRLMPQGVFWSSGKFELSVAAGHELKRLSPSDCIETETRRLNAADDSPESHTFTAYTSSAAVEVEISKRQPDATIRAGSSLTLADPNLNGRLVTQWNLSHGATHQLVGKLSAGWLVEALETIPADAMSEWFIDRSGKEPQIEVQLSHAATASRSVTVIVTARLQRLNVNEPISAETMKMVKWNGPKPAIHLLTFQSNEPYVVVPVGKMLEVALAANDTNDRQLLDPTLDNKIFDITEAGPNAGVQLTVRRGQFTAHIEQETILENETLLQTFHVTAEPKSTPIDRLLVFTSNPLPNGTRWTDKSTSAPIAAEKLAQNDAQRANLPKNGEAWLLRFAQQTSRPVEITAEFANKRPDHASVPLLFLPEAMQQDARIAVHCRNQSALWLEPTHLQTTPLPPNEAPPSEVNDLPPVIAAYRYQPADCRDPALAPKLSVTIVPESKGIPLIARTIHLESFVWPTGKAAHRATYELENHGTTNLKLDLPKGARLASASVDSRLLDVAKPIGDDQPTQIHLPGQTRPTRLSLYFETQGPPLTAGRELTPPTFLRELSFLAGDWTVWLPEEYAATSTGILEATPRYNWRERVFGVLGRPAGSRPFNPFRLSDGASLVNGIADGTVLDPSANVLRDDAQTKNSDERTSAFANPAKSAAPSSFGWRRYREPFIAGGPATIIITHPPAIAAWSAALLLASFLYGRWIRRKYTEGFVVALAVAAAAALLLPFAYFSLASGAVLGLLLSLVADWPLSSITINEPAPQLRTNSAITIATTVVFAFCCVRNVDAQSPHSTANAKDATSKIYRVMIPIDSDRHPVGTKYYISDEFLRALSAAASDSDRWQVEWLLSEAVYSGELTEQAEHKDIAAGTWALTFSVETLARDTVVVLPLNQGDAEWNATAMLDGIPVPLEWRDRGHACAVAIPEPGQYSLSLSCVPKMTSAEGHNQFEIVVPPILGARVDVRYPGTVAGLNVARASLLAVPISAAGSLSAQLGQADRLTVQWSQGDKSESGTSGFAVTDLRWLRIKPDELETTAKFVLEGGTRRPDAITVAYDERWKLLTSEKTLSAKPTGAAATGRRELRIPVAPQSADKQEITLRWRLVDPPTLGNLRLPPIEVTSTQPTKRWLALSSDASLDCEILDSSATVGAANEFLTKWGEAEASDSPDSVLSAFDLRRANNLAIRPRETEPIVEESLNLAVGLTVIRANYEANLTPGLAGASRIELAIPENLTIGGLTVTEDDRAVPVRWSRPAKNRVTAFFGQQLTRPYRLLLDGTAPVDSGGKATIPHISTLATVDATQKTRLYRDDDVQVELEGLPAKNDPKADPPGPSPSNWSVRPVGVCYLESDSAAARVSIKPNKLKITGDSLTSINRENGSWWANFRCQLLVEEGNVDSLKLHLPGNCTGPFEVQSALSTTTEFKLLSDQSGSLSVRLATTIAKGGSIDLRVRAPLKAGTGTQVAVPIVGLDSLAGGHRYIGVPEFADSQAISWTDTGVSPATLPLKLRPASAPTPSLRYYEVVSDPFQVASRPPATREAAPQVRLADTAVIAGEFGTQRITTRLILAPHGLTDCAIQLPPSQTLVSVELDGRPAVVRQLDPSQWQVTLGSPQLPQLLQIVSRSAAGPASDNATDLQRPTLVAHGQTIPAEMSLWSCAYPQRSIARVVTGADETTAAEQAALRFDRLVSIAEAAKGTAAELPSPDGYNWFLPWAKLLNTARTETQHVNVPTAAQRVENQVSHTAEDQIAQAAVRLDKWLDDCRKTLVASRTANARANSAIDSPIAPGSVRPSGEWTYYVAEGGNDRLPLRLEPVGLTSTQSRLVGLVVTAGLLAATIWLLRRPAAIDYLHRWPHACGVLIGIAYWAWLWPSWVGILIAAASLWLALRFAWPGRAMRTEASTVLRSSRTA